MVLLLDPYVDAILLLALAFLIVGIMRSLTPFLQKIPWVGGGLANAADGMARAIAHACGIAVRGIDNAIGASFHAVARFLGRSWGELRAHALAILETATTLGLLVNAYHGIRSLVHRLEHARTHTLGSIKHLEREFHGIEHRVKSLEKELAHGIGDDVLPRIKTLDREVARLEHRVIPGIRSDVATAEGDVTALGEYVRSHYLADTREAITAAVAVGLAALGLSGLRCNSLLNSLNKRGCGFWRDLEGLLGILGDVLLLTSLCQLIPVIEEAYAVIAAPFVAAMTEAAEVVCHASANASPDLQPPALSLPPNPGVTLNLP